jgi:hypothetical protein
MFLPQRYWQRRDFRKADTLKYLNQRLCPAIHEAGELTWPIMSYSKKDEDADQAIMRVDRTSVFQEGKEHTPLCPS